jgi:hypothetical protein
VPQTALCKIDPAATHRRVETLFRERDKQPCSNPPPHPPKLILPSPYSLLFFILIPDLFPLTDTLYLRFPPYD